MRDRLPPLEEPWISRRAWRRIVEAHASGRISSEELASLKRRVARVRHVVPARADARRPMLRLVPGGGGRQAPPDPDPSNPTPLEAA